MLYTIKFTNTHRAINLDQIVKYDLSTISPTLIVDSTYVSHVSDQFDNTDDFISIPLYKRNQFCLLPANSSLTIETENSQEAIYYKQLTIDNCHIDVSDSSGGGGSNGSSDNELVKQIFSMRYNNETLIVPDYVQTFDPLSVPYTQYLNTIVIPDGVDVRDGYFEIYEIPALYNFHNDRDIFDYSVNTTDSRKFVETNYVMSLFLYGYDFDISTIENRSTFNFGVDISNYNSLLESMTAHVGPRRPFVDQDNPEYSSSGHYSVVHLINDNFHIMILSQAVKGLLNSGYIFDFTDTLPDDPENYIIFEWVEETNELKNSLTHDIDMNRNDSVYAYMSKEQFLSWAEYTESYVAGSKYCREIDDYTGKSIMFDSCVYAGNGMDSGSSGYQYKTNFNKNEEEDNFSCIPVEKMEQFQICNGKTRIYLDKNLVYSQIII